MTDVFANNGKHTDVSAAYSASIESLELELEEAQNRIKELEQRVKELEKNLQKAFDLGQKYEHYSEHEFVSYNKKSADIMAEFKALTTNNDSE